MKSDMVSQVDWLSVR